MIEGRPRESLVLYEAPFEVSFVSDLFSKFKFKAHSDENLFVFQKVAKGINYDQSNIHGKSFGSKFTLVNNARIPTACSLLLRYEKGNACPS